MNLSSHRIARQVVPESTIARVSAFALVSVMLLVNIFSITQLHLNDRHHEIEALVEAEFHSLESALMHTTPQALSENHDLVKSGELKGILIASAAGLPVVAMGSIPNASVVSSLVENGSGAWSMFDDDHADVMWLLDMSSESMSTIMRVDVSKGISDAWSNTYRRMLYALGLMVVAGFGALLLVNRLVTQYFVRPAERLVNYIESWQDRQGDAMEPKEVCQGAPHLLPIAESFSDLIEQQKVADRQVRVKQKYLEFAAHHDPLTHLPNRLKFDEVLRSTVASAREHDASFAVFIIDIDNFKIFNDQYGHVVGDRMVSEVGNRLRGLIGENDLVARLDGDEFVVIKTDMPNREQVEEVANQIMEEVTAPFVYRGFNMKISVSVGISGYPFDTHTSHDQNQIGENAVNNASVAMQEAKTTGKSQYLFFNESMRSKITERIRLEADLKAGLKNCQFEVWYQPKINIQTRKVIGAEALVRWNHPEQGFISPEIFIPVAEEAGMIIELGRWILQTACQQTQDMQKNGYEGVGVAVNISAVQFTDGDLIPMVSSAMSDSNLSPMLLELEITESAVLHDPEEVIESLHELRKLGIRLAIDDFGTGYSSLAYLKRFPVDTLKIDRAFITDLSSDNDDVAIVDAVLGLGKHFNMKVVAEGVEEETQLHFLKDRGCDIAQGYFVSRPMSYPDYISWLASYSPGYQSCFDTAANDDANGGNDDSLSKVVNQ